ncbi:MAG: arsenite methyltransferase [bacterium]
MTTNRTSDEQRKEVSQAYSEAILKTTTSSCCSPGCCAPPGTFTAESIGYKPGDLAKLPLEAATSSFGCGNPLAFADVKEGETVVDLGSGAGLDLLLAGEKVGPTGQVIGIDMTDAMIEQARRNIARAGVDNVEVRKGIIEALPVDTGTVDWVISNCVINLSPEKDRVFAEISRVLRPGGTMQVSDIVASELPDWVRARSDLFTACIGGAVTEDEYVAGLRSAGLESVEVRERFEYDASQIKAFLESEELPATSEAQVALTPDEIDRIATTLAGKVWSAKIVARKPLPE